MRVLFTLFVCVWAYKADCASAPFITPCRATDTACMQASAQAAVPVVAAGVPELGIPVMDPMLLERVTSNQAGLEMDFRNTLVKGLRNCKVLTLKRKTNKTYLDLQCSVIMTGDYTLGGRLLLLPIEGNGKYKIKIRDIIVKIVYDIEDRVENGQKYWHVKNWKHSAEVKTGVEFNFQNLFNGNKELGDMIHQVANERWQEIFQEVAPPILYAVVQKIIDQTSKIFDNVPEDQLAIP